MSDPRAIPSLRDLEGASWFALLSGPIAWFIDQQTSYGLTDWVCARGFPIVLYLANAAAFVIAVLGAITGFRRWQQAGNAPLDLDQPASHAGFLALLGLMLSSFFASPIIAQTIATFILGACQR